jgi:hypothetical protein
VLSQISLVVEVVEVEVAAAVVQTCQVEVEAEAEAAVVEVLLRPRVMQSDFGPFDYV